MADSPIARLSSNPYPSPTLGQSIVSALLAQFDAWRSSLNACVSAAAAAANSGNAAGTAIGAVQAKASKILADAPFWSLSGELGAAHAVATSDPNTWTSPLDGWSITTPQAAFSGDWIKDGIQEKFSTELGELYQLILQNDTIPIADETVTVQQLYNPELGVIIGT